MIEIRTLPGTTFDATGSQAIVHADQNIADARGANAVDLQSVRAASTQVASGAQSFIGSGLNNTVSGAQSGIICGSSNINSGLNSMIACGTQNLLSATGGGCFIGTGALNQIPGAGLLNTIITGFINTVGPTNLGCAIITGNQCSIPSGNYNAIVTGELNNCSGSYSGIVSGINNSANGLANFIGSGADNTITSGLSSILNGANNSVSNDNSTILGGSGVQTSASYEVSWGGVRQSSTNGTAQCSQYTLIANTTNATATRTSISGTTATALNQISIESDRTKAFHIHITAMQQRTQGSASAYFQRKVLIQNLNGTTALVGSVQTIGTDIGSNAGGPPAGWAVSLTADNTNDQLNLTVTGTAATNIRWVARIDSVQVGYT